MSDYVPKPDPEGINSSQETNHVKDAAILLVGFLVILASGYFVLIKVSDWAVTKLSIEREMQWLGKMWKASEKDAPDHKELNDLLTKVNPHLPFKMIVNVLCREEINAGALPGGRVFLTAGLLKNIKSENGLVFVLGHEAGHIVHRDHVRGLGRQIIFSLGAGIMGFGDATSLSLINTTLSRVYDRGQESEADEYALELNKKTFGQTWGAQELFEILAKDETVLQRSFARLASTHPPSLDRFEKIKLSQTGQPQPLVQPARPFSEWPKEFGCP